MIKAHNGLIGAFLLYSAFSPKLVFCQAPARSTPSPTESRPDVPAFGHSIHGEVFNEGPRARAILLRGMGKVDFPVTTKNLNVQSLINQGVAQLHSFYYYEAERSFRTAAMIDPECAMAYWGMAMANVNNPKRAEGFLKEAQKRKDKTRISAREQLYVDALAAFYREGGSEESGTHGWVHGLEKVVQESPTDLDARAWLALAVYQSDQIGSRQAVDIVLDSILQVEPTHPGAHHYRIHLWDHENATRALGSAANYAATARGIAHAWHMPGHTYTELKRYGEAVFHQEASSRVDHASMARDQTMPFEIHNYAHNNQWLCTSLSHIGRVKDAIAVARNLVEQPRDPDKNNANDGGSAQRNGRLRWAEVLMRYELWDELIEATRTGALDWSDVPFEKMMRSYSLGLAYALKADQAGLAREIASLKSMAAEEARKTAEMQPNKVTYELDLDDASKVSQSEVAKQVAASLKTRAVARAESRAARAATPEAAVAAAGSFGQSQLPTIQTALAELEGYELLAKGDVGIAFVKFSRATTMRPEARARAHLKVQNYAFARTSAQAAVERAPNQLPPLAAYVEIMAATGREKEAQDRYRELEVLARHADTNLPVLVRIRSVVDGWKSSGNWSSRTSTDVAVESPINHVDLASLGPLTWTPSPAKPFVLPDTEGEPWDLAKHRGRNVLVLFYLGGKCAHCMQQLRDFGKAIDALGMLRTDVVAVSTDSLEDTKVLRKNPEGITFPMPLLADPTLELFRAYRAFDEFEAQPLHGTFLINEAGQIHWQRISADPFLDISFLKTEIQRINRSP
jgi:peroxiredoxin